MTHPDFDAYYQECISKVGRIENGWIVAGARINYNFNKTEEFAS
jgi:hypothetical protein